ncbi:MAG: electron transport complex subunit RsxB [Gammaproteobacteria bacterium]|nr:electron transport complex subunit RsxB [Gammaproteobacteria bacterium]MBT8443240.1 electron transport complex subunit RsxB [Gammaproteobacteria bacterium]NND37117.1 electron transport complex subunit RsxB [Gammaproteobacteria bacterium]
MLAAAAVIASLALAIAAVLGIAARRFTADADTAIEKVNRLLPQTQCGQCGFPGCRPYATAIVEQDAPLNRCPPGGESTIVALADLLNRPPSPPDTAYGVSAPPAVAVVDEDACIGCALCLQACPVDAILGARRYMHTVIESECTGCELCVAPCPVDCIRMDPIS